MNYASRSVPSANGILSSPPCVWFSAELFLSSTGSIAKCGLVLRFVRMLREEKMGGELSESSQSSQSRPAKIGKSKVGRRTRTRIMGSRPSSLQSLDVIGEAEQKERN